MPQHPSSGTAHLSTMVGSPAPPSSTTVSAVSITEDAPVGGGPSSCAARSLAAWWWLSRRAPRSSSASRRAAAWWAPRGRPGPPATACWVTSRASSSTSATPTSSSTAAARSRCGAWTASRSAPRGRAPLGAERRAADHLPLPGPGARLLRASYRLAVPDNVPVGSGAERHRALDGRARLGAVPTGAGTIAATASAASAARELRLRRRARAVGCSADRMELRSRAGDVRAVVPAGRYRVDAESEAGTAACAGSRTPRRAVPGPGAEHERRRGGRGRVVTAALDLSPHLRAARRALLYLVVGLGQGLTYLLVIGGGLVLGVLLAPLWVGLPLLVGHRAARVAAGRGRAPAGQPAAGDAPAAGPPPAPRGTGVREEHGRRRVLARARDAPAQAAGLAGRAGRRRPARRAGGRARRARRERARRRRRAARRPVGARPGRRRRAVPARAAGRDRLDRRARGRRRGAARARPPPAALARRRGGPGARDARRASRRPLAQHRLLAARARDLRRRRRPPGTLPTPAPAASGPRSTAAARVVGGLDDPQLDTRRAPPRGRAARPSGARCRSPARRRRRRR